MSLKCFFIPSNLRIEPDNSFHLFSRACGEKMIEIDGWFFWCLHFTYHLIFLTWYVSFIQSFQLEGAHINCRDCRKKSVFPTNKSKKNSFHFFEIYKLCPFLSWTKKIVYTRIERNFTHKAKKNSKSKESGVA